MGGRYSNVLLQTLLVLVKRPPPEGKKVLIIGTTSLPDVMETLELTACFSVSLHVASLDASNLASVVLGLGLKFASSEDESLCMEAMPASIPIKKLILVLEMATTEVGGSKVISYQEFAAAVTSVGLAR